MTETADSESTELANELAKVATDAAIERFPKLEFLSKLLDRYHLDGLIGLIPGWGDAATGVGSLAILGVAFARKVPTIVLARMLLNIAVDVGLGLIPVLGDVFDFFHGANRKNLAMLKEHLAPVEPRTSGEETTTAIEPARKGSMKDYAIVFAALTLVAVSIAAPFVFAGVAIDYLMTLFQGS